MRTPISRLRWTTPTIFFVQTGYSIYTLRQASRRSWRIGQREPVGVAFFTYSETAQERCLRLMGKKLLVSLALEEERVALRERNVGFVPHIVVATLSGAG